MTAQDDAQMTGRPNCSTTLTPRVALARLYKCHIVAYMRLYCGCIGMHDQPVTCSYSVCYISMVRIAGIWHDS